MRFRVAGGVLCCVMLASLFACSTPGEEKYKMTDAQLGLTPLEADGRRIYGMRCLNCHESYTTKPRNGPSLKGLYHKPVMPSGTPANDERIAEVIVMGKRMMPPTPLTEEQTKALLAYLHTL
jgi:hypothetical protein